MDFFYHLFCTCWLSNMDGSRLIYVYFGGIGDRDGNVPNAGIGLQDNLEPASGNDVTALSHDGGRQRPCKEDSNYWGSIAASKARCTMSTLCKRATTKLPRVCLLIYDHISVKTNAVQQRKKKLLRCWNAPDYYALSLSLEIWLEINYRPAHSEV